MFLNMIPDRNRQNSCKILRMELIFPNWSGGTSFENSERHAETPPQLPEKEKS